MTAVHEADRPIGEVARSAGVSVRTLRYYEAVGLLRPVERAEGGHRRYDAQALVRLRRILALRGLGFGLDAIARLLERDDRASLVEAVRRQLERTEVELEVAGRLRSRLRRVLDTLEHSADEPLADLIDELEVDPVNVSLTQIYTKLGDAGETHLGDMTRVRKTHPLIEAGGAVDELRAQIALLLAVDGLPERERSWLKRIANDLMDAGSDLSVPVATARPRVDDGYVTWIEGACDEANESLEGLESFVLWFGQPRAAQLDICRALCRRVERRVLEVDGANPQIIRYLNRLSDLLFILGRSISGGHETLWEPGRGAELSAG